MRTAARGGHEWRRYSIGHSRRKDPPVTRRGWLVLRGAAAV